ncbi:MAG: hypothetical protein JWO98_5513 [Frankiales bacterium]|nr:hypothetical protein [Frankiales bacterium]
MLPQHTKLVKIKNTLEVLLHVINIGNLLNHNRRLYQNSFTGANSGSVDGLKWQDIGTVAGYT